MLVLVVTGLVLAAQQVAYAFKLSSAASEITILTSGWLFTYNVHHITLRNWIVLRTNVPTLLSVLQSNS